MQFKSNEIFSRTELVIGSEAMQTLQSKKVILFGLGGVGSWCAEGLIRSGITQLTIVDADYVAPSNINRQLPATTTTVGLLKVDVLKKRLQEINPEAKITAIAEIYREESSESFRLEQYDYIIDAIDTLQHKAHLLLAASKTSATVFSSMGAALKIDSQQIKVTDFWKVKGCRLASALRQRFRKGEKPHKKIMCVYSEEIFENKAAQLSEKNNDKTTLFHKPTINGSLVHITAIFGFTLSGMVIWDVNKSVVEKQL